jgi:hypothetical protein
LVENETEHGASERAIAYLAHLSKKFSLKAGPLRVLMFLFLFVEVASDFSVILGDTLRGCLVYGST